MNAILILLGLFAVMMFLSNLGFLNKANAFSFISVPIMIGIFFSPENGLIPMLPSTLKNLSWAIHVALTWITFVSGTRLLTNLPDLNHIRRLFPIFIAYAIFIMTTFLILFISGNSNGIFETNNSIFKLIIMALVLSSVIFSSKENPFLLPIFFLCLFYLFKDTYPSFTLLNILIPLGTGLLMAAVCGLIISRKDTLNTTSVLTLLGLCTLGTGIAIGTNNLEVILGLSFGCVMAFVHKYGVCADPKMGESLIPIKFVIALFCGLLIDINIPIIIIGTFLALTRIGLKALILSLSSQETKESLLSNMPISILALPIVLSLQLSVFKNEDTQFILSCFCIAFIVNDIAALVIEKTSLKNTNDKNKINTQNKTHNSAIVGSDL